VSLMYDPSRDSLLHPWSRPPVFDATNVRQAPQDGILAECARLAYFRFERDDHQRAQWRAALDLLEVQDVAWFSEPATDSQAYAFHRTATGQSIVAFRGTEPDALSDLGSDIDTLLTDWRAQPGQASVRVHAGFAGALDRLAAMPAFADWIDRHQGTLVFTGHSLGAALATLAAARWKASRLVTFGSPRVGAASLTARVSAQSGEVRRHVDCCDLVTELPPPIGDFEHVGEMTYIDSDGGLPPGNGIPVAVDRAQARVDYLEQLAWRFGTVPVRDLADHAPINYVRAWF